MAELRQDFVKFEHDEFLMRYVVVDSTNILGWRAAWFLTRSLTSPTTGNTIRRRANTWNTTTCTNSPTAISTANGFPTTGVTLASSYFQVNVQYGDFDDFVPGDQAYHELVLSENGDQCKSLVVSSGFITINTSLFTEQPYR